MPKLNSILVMLMTFQVIALSANPDSIQIRDVWISETPPGVTKNAAYLEIENTGNETIILQSVDSPDFERVEIHRSVVKDDKVRMQFQSEVEIEPNSIFQFSPGDFHLMLIKPSKRMRSGDMSSLNLNFLTAGKFTVNAEVKKLQSEHTHHH
jgi:periplasmic copper chaperone A